MKSLVETWPPEHGLGALATIGWEEVLEAFIGASCDSRHTARSYRRHCGDACRALGIRTLAEVNGAMLASYRGQVVTNQDLAPGSRVQALACFRSFLNWSWVVGAHHLDERIIKMSLRSPRSVVMTPYRVLTDAEATRLWRTARKSPASHALMCVTLGAGLRTSEICSLRVKDCHLALEGGPAIYVHQGKGGKDRTVPVLPEHFEGILHLLRATDRTLDSPGALFLSRFLPRLGLPLSPNAVRERLAKALAAAGMDRERTTVHGLRHMYALTVLRNCGNVIAVQKLLGHSSVATTMRYVDHLELADLRGCLRRAS